MTHPGQRLSALIDGELEDSERQRVLLHVTKCYACRQELAALSAVKRRTSALRDAAAHADLVSALAGVPDRVRAERDPADEPTASPWPARGGESPWPARGGEQSARGQASGPEQRFGRYFIAGSLVVFLAGLGTAAFIAGGEPQPQAPSLPVTPSVDVMVFGHGPASDLSNVPLPTAQPSNRQPRHGLSVHAARTGT